MALLFVGEMEKAAYYNCPKSKRKGYFWIFLRLTGRYPAYFLNAIIGVLFNKEKK